MYTRKYTVYFFLVNFLSHKNVCFMYECYKTSYTFCNIKDILMQIQYRTFHVVKNMKTSSKLYVPFIFRTSHGIHNYNYKAIRKAKFRVSSTKNKSRNLTLKMVGPH